MKGRGVSVYPVEQATNGVEALTFRAEHNAPVDLILSDAVMPKLGGVAMFKALRQRGLQQPVIMISGHPLTRGIEELHDLGLFAWITRPPATDQLARTLAAALREKEG